MSIPLPLDRTANAPLNLAVVRRVDPDVLDIVASANFVAIYEYAEDKGEWVRREGRALRLRARCGRARALPSSYAPRAPPPPAFRPRRRRRAAQARH